MRRCTVVLALCLTSSAFAAQCGNTTIHSAADADALRKACRVVDGTITIPLSLNELENISLDGIEVINGDLRSYNCGSISIKRRSSTNSSVVSFSSSTLTTIHGDLALDGCIPDFTNISFPNLKTIDGAFDLVNTASLAYLDITNLDSVGYFRLHAPTLVTMVHKELRNVTGAHGTKKVVVEETSLTSVDSLFRNPLDIGDSPASIGGKTLMFENYPTQTLTNATFGFARAGSLSIEGNGTLYVTLGGPEQTTMALTNLTFSRGTAGLIRNPQLANLTVETVTLGSYNNFTDLMLPFDSMSSLTILYEQTLTQLELPPQAVNYTNFSFTLFGCTNLNLSSQFTTDPDGTTRQTWYWPQKDINSLSLVGNIATPFL
ncbi:hypothetical protein T069G_04108 [Trichoderma breve]|uniref:Uncharacterized protein n=1 Tax=Trichoderma breve TaxID=2034170 RepID=A0A9W9EAJ8_9HYPO|nr:hypothetical protein T069G_04108 [Trichoderma breve]KAJ4863154.1 hypothetical protein T069G_04108 [Trichoderma breve]